MNGSDNSKWSPNENDGREMMELFTLGAGRGYGEADARQNARNRLPERLEGRRRQRQLPLRPELPRHRREGPVADADRLTPRQHETLFLLADGLSTEEIADSLGVARETARNYVRRLLRVMGVHSRLEAVVKARELGLLYREKWPRGFGEPPADCG